MEYIEYGTVINSGMPHPDDPFTEEAMITVRGSISLENRAVMPTRISTRSGEEIPAMALVLGGKVAGEDTRIQAVFISSWMDIGALAQMLLSAAERDPDPAALSDFTVGYYHERNS